MNRGLKLQKIRIRLTGAGSLYIILTLTMGVVAVNAGNNLLYLAVSGLLSLLVLSGLLAYANLRGLASSLKVPEEIYASRPLTASLELSNKKRRLPTFLIACPGNVSGEVLVEIAPGGKASMPVRLIFDERGRQPLGPQVITSVFPFGLISRGGSFDLGSTCVVYPRPIPVSWTFLEKEERKGEELFLPQAGVGGDYRGIRDYVPGDAISRVHWKGWLRHRRLMTKEFEAEGAYPVSFAYDSVPGPGQEERLGQLTWLVRTELRRGRAVGLRLPGKYYPPGRGRLHRKILLTALALYGRKNESA